MWFFMILGFLIIFIIIFVIYFKKREKIYFQFLMTNSISLNNLININEKYNFYTPVNNFDYSKTYDNKIFYDSISCEDYLIYQLQFKKNIIQKEIELINKNKESFLLYNQKISEIQTFGEYKSMTKLKKKHLLSMEKKLFEQKKLNPIINFKININLSCAKINGSIYRSKSQSFSSEQITYLINKLNNKSKNFYNDKMIWDALCRVERGKVSNKMRFSIYQRDGYRCKICGRKENYLEIDHIKPIAKGGKSTYDNLQTLCKRCNKIKGDTY